MGQFFQLIRLLKSYRLYSILGVLFQVLTAIFTLVSIPLVIPFFQILFGTSPSSMRAPDTFWDIESTLNYGFSRLIAMSDRPTALVVVCIAVVIIFFFRNMFRFLASFFIVPAVNGVIRDLRKNIFRAYTDMSIKMRKESKKGNLLALIGTDLSEVDHGIVKALELLFKSPLIVIGSVGFMVWLSPELSIIASVLILFTFLIIGGLSHSLKKPSLRVQETLAEINIASDEYLQAKKLIDGYNANSYFIDRFDIQNNRLYKTANFILRKRDLASPLTELLGVIAVVILLWSGSQLVFSDKMGPTTFFTFIFAFYHIIDPAKRFSREFANVHKGMAALNRINSFISSTAQNDDHPVQGKKINTFSHSIDFNEVSFGYKQTDDPILKQLSFTIKKGEKIGIMGLSGTGKTSLLDLLLGYYPEYYGKILMDDVDIRQYNLDEYRKMFGLVSQEPILFHTSLKDNIVLNRTFDSHSFEVAISQAQIAQLLDSKGVDSDSAAGDLGMKLSGGERQRITIARALYGYPEILLLDEPTSALDMRSESHVYRALFQAMADRTVILISHNLELLNKMDRILVLHNGSIVQEGSGKELMEEKGLFAELLSLKHERN